MTNAFLPLDKRPCDYLLSVYLSEPEVPRRLREQTARDRMAKLQIAPGQVQFMVLLVANTLWSGAVADPDTRGIREFDAMLPTDQRVAISLLPVADGRSCY